MPTTLFAKKANGDNPFGGGDNTPAVSESSFSAAPAASSFAAAPAPTPTTITQGAPQMSQQTSAPQPMYNTQAGENAAQGADFVKNDNTDWINKKWRPVMGWVYMATCTSDFVLFPVLWSILQTLQGGQVTSQWQPLTLQGAGLYHIAMGAVLGIAAYGRTKEKVAGAS
jgi:hypothetical protein